MKDRITVTTKELMGAIEWLDAKGTVILKIEDDRSGSGGWIIYLGECK